MSPAHSQPLDDITAEADNAVTDRNRSRPGDRTSPILSASATESGPRPCRRRSAGNRPSRVRKRRAPPPPQPGGGSTDTADTEDDRTRHAELSHRPAKRPPKNPPRPCPKLNLRAGLTLPKPNRKRAEPAPPAPKPSVVSHAGRPRRRRHRRTGHPGTDERLNPPPVSDDMADRLGDVLERLRKGNGRNGTGQNGARARIGDLTLVPGVKTSMKAKSSGYGAAW